MEPNEALAELTELSSQVEDAAILGETGFVLASTGVPERGEQLARVAAELLSAAADVRAGGQEVTRVDVALPAGSVCGLTTTRVKSACNGGTAECVSVGTATGTTLARIR